MRIEPGTTVWYIDGDIVKTGVTVESYGNLGEWLTYTIEGRGDERFFAFVTQEVAEFAIAEMQRRFGGQLHAR